MGTNPSCLLCPKVETPYASPLLGLFDVMRMMLSPSRASQKRKPQ
jgi:hypothetical protein